MLARNQSGSRRQIVVRWRLTIGVIAGLAGGCAWRNDAVNVEGRSPTDQRAAREIANAFASDERSSSGVNTTLQSCFDRIDDVAGGALPASHMRNWYCICMTDALGVPYEPAESVEQASKTCRSFAQGTQAGTTADTRTPYTGGSALTAGQIAGAHQRCTERAVLEPNTAALPTLSRDAYCSCLVDSMRVRRTASTETPADVATNCLERANGARW